MGEEKENISGDETVNKESNALDQDDISKLIEEMQGEDNSSETNKQAEKTTDDETKQEPDETKNDETENKESNNLNQDDISNLIDEMQTEEKSSENEKKEDKTEHEENDNEGENNAESEESVEENTQIFEHVDDFVNEKGEEGQGEIRERDEKPDEKDEKVVEEDKKSENQTVETDNIKENDEEDNDSFKGLDSDDEDEIDGSLDSKPDAEPDSEPETEKDENNNEDNDNKIKKNDEDKKSEKDENSGQTVKIKEAKKAPKGKRVKRVIPYILCVVSIVVLFGLYTLFTKSETEHIKPEKPFQAKHLTKPEDKSSEKHNAQKAKVDETKDIILSDSIIAKLDEIIELRDELLIKEREIDDLIISYENGISEMEDEILRIKQNQQMDSFSTAIKNKKIEFGMMIIQRRLAYIEKIDPPYKWLNQGIEELLYLKRKIEIDSKIDRVISGIDMEKMIQEIDIVTQSYRTGIENLKIDMKNVEFTPFEMIWKRIIDKENFVVGNTEKDDEPSGKDKPVISNEEKNNRMIWEEICNGNFKRKNEMTKLSTKAAKCFSKWKHADLFLNGISELSPEVAKYLLKWTGDWICLNGVKKLSPEAAQHLFQWQGKLISLNGLSQISPGLLKHLPKWKGKQLELMGLKYQKSKVEQVGLRSLAKWEKLGGKLYIPVQIRKAINKS